MTQQPPLPAGLVDYLVQRDTDRADKVAALLAALTDREQALIRNVAVMGYVRGRMHPEGEDHPKDSAVLAEVIDACLAHPDLYPAVDAVQQHTTSSTVEYFLQTQQPDGEWGDSSSYGTDATHMATRLERRRSRHPQWEHRIAWRITTVVVGALPEHVAERLAP